MPITISNNIFYKRKSQWLNTASTEILLADQDLREPQRRMPSLIKSFAKNVAVSGRKNDTLAL